MSVNCKPHARVSLTCDTRAVGYSVGDRFGLTL